MKVGNSIYVSSDDLPGTFITEDKRGYETKFELQKIIIL